MEKKEQNEVPSWDDQSFFRILQENFLHLSISMTDQGRSSCMPHMIPLQCVTNRIELLISIPPLSIISSDWTGFTISFHAMNPENEQRFKILEAPFKTYRIFKLDEAYFVRASQQNQHSNVISPEGWHHRQLRPDQLCHFANSYSNQVSTYVWMAEIIKQTGEAGWMLFLTVPERSSGDMTKFCRISIWGTRGRTKQMLIGALSHPLAMYVQKLLLANVPTWMDRRRRRLTWLTRKGLVGLGRIQCGSAAH